MGCAQLPIFSNDFIPISLCSLFVPRFSIHGGINCKSWKFRFLRCLLAFDDFSIREGTNDGLMMDYEGGGNNCVIEGKLNDYASRYLLELFNNCKYR